MLKPLRIINLSVECFVIKCLQKQFGLDRVLSIFRRDCFSLRVCVSVFLEYRLAAILPSQFVLKLSQLVLHFSNPHLCALPVHTQLSHPASRRGHTHTPLDDSMEDKMRMARTTFSLVNKWQGMIVWWTVRSLCLITKWATRAPMVPGPFPFASVCVCYRVCVYVSSLGLCFI